MNSGRERCLCGFNFHKEFGSDIFSREKCLLETKQGSAVEEANGSHVGKFDPGFPIRHLPEGISIQFLDGIRPFVYKLANPMSFSEMDAPNYVRIRQNRCKNRQFAPR